MAIIWSDLPSAPENDTAAQRFARAAEGHPCLRCPKPATTAYVIQTDAGPRWLDLCAADSDALVAWLNREIVVTELPTPANPDPEPPASPMVALAEFLSTADLRAPEGAYPLPLNDLEDQHPEEKR